MAAPGLYLYRIGKYPTVAVDVAPEAWSCAICYFISRLAALQYNCVKTELQGHQIKTTTKQ
jgi:hypothetical protein